jgi:hydrogenase/urease accessory protein HupE
MGYDHLLFVLCLVLLASSLRRVLVMVTGFTLAHSMTLGLAALGVLRAPIALIELLIAVSVLLLAVELAKGPRPTLTHQYPILVSSFFGLLHGLGFAAALTQIGLPDTDVVWALLAFNVGCGVGAGGVCPCAIGFGAADQPARQGGDSLVRAGKKDPHLWGWGCCRFLGG